MTNHRTLLLVLCASLSAACTAFSCDDGLSPDEWDARELQRATARLADARLALEQEFSRALRTQIPKGPVLDQLTTPVQESYLPGGIYTLGPRLRRHGLFSTASRYLVYRHHIRVTPQEVILMFSQSATRGTAGTSVIPLPYSDIKNVSTSTLLKRASLSLTSRRAKTIYMLVFALEDSARVTQLAALILQRAPTSRN
jgi:hypothetical protein